MQSAAQTSYATLHIVKQAGNRRADKFVARPVSPAIVIGTENDRGIKQILEVNYCWYDRSGKHQHQPFDIVSRQKTGEVQHQHGDGDYIINC